MRAILRNAAVLSVTHVAGYFIPLLEVPVLARALGPVSYGQVVFVQSIGLLSSLIVEYGFNLSASRQVALLRHDLGALGRVLSDVVLAKLILSAAIVIGGLLFVLFFDVHSRLPDMRLVLWAGLYFIAFGFSPFWYFQGQERLVGPAVLELSLRGIGLLVLVLLVRDDRDAVPALAIMSSVGLINTLITTGWCYRQVGFSRFSLVGALAQIRQGFHVFVYRSSGNILMNAAPSVLGFAAGPAALSVFVPAEKVVRGVIGLAAPVLTALYPDFARRVYVAEPGTLRRAWWVVFAVALTGLAGAFSLWLFGPTLLELVLGSQYVATGELLDWFVWLIPLRMTNQTVGMVLLLPARKDRISSSLLLLCSVVALGLGGGLAVGYGATGMVAGFVAAEMLLLVALMVVALGISQRSLQMNAPAVRSKNQ